MQRKNLWLIIPGSIITIILVIGILSFFGIFISPFSTEYCGCHSMMPNYSLLIFGILLILAVIPVSHYFISKKMEDKLNEHMEILSKFINKPKQKFNKTVDQRIFKFLNFNEKKILEKLIKDKEILQSEVSKMKGMTKLKAHRVIKNLEQKGIIKTEQYAKTKKIFLTNDIKKLLSL